MRHRRTDVVDAALRVLDEHGLGDLSMRRLAAELDVRPSALYHHVASKQELLAAVATRIVGRAPRPETTSGEAAVRAECRALRDAMLAWRDGAEVVATVHAYGLGPHEPGARLASALRDAGLDERFARAAARTMLHFVFGHVLDEQTHLQAASAGAIDDEPDGGDAADGASFEQGLDLLLAGVRAHATSV
jgi:AcrR family transcriptional regulator